MDNVGDRQARLCGQLLFPTLDFPIYLFGAVLRQEPSVHHSSLQQDNETD